MFKPKDRIELVSMPNDPSPVPTGAKGTVMNVCPDPFERGAFIYGVAWDNGRTLNLCTPTDSARKIS
jgi:hypothetical protein